MSTSLYYGGFSIVDDTQTVIVTGNTYVKAANSTQGMGCYGFTHSDNRLTFDGHTGREIHVQANVTMTTSAATQVFLAIFKNGKEVWPHAAIQRAVTVGTDHGAATIGILCPMRKGDYVELWVTTDDGDEVNVTGGTVIAQVVG